MLLSLVVPCYNEQDNVERFYEETVKAFAGSNFDYEFVFVNDGSKDDSLSVCRALAAGDERIKIIDKPNSGVSASRNVVLSGLPPELRKLCSGLSTYDMPNRVASSSCHSQSPYAPRGPNSCVVGIQKTVPP